MGKSTISMAIFNSYVKLPEGIFGKNMVHILGENEKKRCFLNWRLRYIMFKAGGSLELQGPLQSCELAKLLGGVG